MSVSGRILWCARDGSAAPLTAETGFEPLRIVLGILGYRRDFLERYGTLARTPLEQAEAIDQSRIIEHDVTLQSVEFGRGYPGINEPREVEAVQACLNDDPRQQAVFSRITSSAAEIPSGN